MADYSEEYGQNEELAHDLAVQKYEDTDPDNKFMVDNEFIKFIKELADNKSIKDIVQYIETNRWTDRQKRTIMAYAKIILGGGLSTSYIIGSDDYQSLYDDKALVDCDLMLGMTTFDVTPEFNLLRGLIDVHFGLETRKSLGGFFIKRIGTQRMEYEHEERIRERKTGFKEKILNRIR